jgi:hypothetical protein
MRNHDLQGLGDKKIINLFIKNNLIINKIIFKESKKFRNLDFRKYFFYSLISFIFSNLKNRRSSFTLFYLLTVINQFFKITKVLFSCSKVVINDNNKIVEKKSIISYGFPTHSFNLSVDKYNSYADFLDSKFRNFSIISINEYLNKKTLIDKNLDDLKKIKSKKRYLFFFQFSAIECVNNLCILLKNYLSIRKKINFLIAIEFLIFKLRENYLNNLLEYFKKKKIDVKEIHFLPFSNFIPKNVFLNINIKSFIYGDSISLFPIYKIKKKNNENFLKYIPFNNFTIGESCYGKNVSENILSKILKKKLNFDFQKNNINKKFEYYNLGFSIHENHKQYEKKKYLVLFDSPPKKEVNILGEYVSLNPVEKFIFYKNFFAEIAEVTKYLKIKVLFKPKYLIISEYYDDAYYLLFKEIRNNYKNIEIIDPYIKISSLINAAKMTLSFPCATTVRFFESQKINSFYYLPLDFIFLKNYMTSKETISGPNQLKKILLNNF